MKPLFEYRRVVFALAAALLPVVGARADDRVSIEAKVNGHPVHLAFDTGTGVPLVLFRDAAEKLGLKINPFPADAKPGSGNAVMMGLTEPSQLEMTGKSFANAQFYVLEVPSYFNDIQGLAGWPAFRNIIVLLKIAEHRVVFLGPEEMPPEAAGWTKLRVRPDHDILCLELPGNKGAPAGTVLIDTGDEDAVSLSNERWREWKAAHPSQPVTLSAAYMPGAGLTVAEVSWADELSLDGLVLHGVVVKECNAAQARLGGPGYAASLGLGALARLDLAINGKGGVAYTHPRTDAPLASKHNRLGAVFVPRSDQNDELVAHVAVGSPAALAGVRDDDVLLAIGELDVTPWRTHPEILPFRKYWEKEAGTKVVLTLKRDQEILKVTATLKNLLGP